MFYRENNAGIMFLGMFYMIIDYNKGFKKHQIFMSK